MNTLRKRAALPGLLAKGFSVFGLVGTQAYAALLAAGVGLGVAAGAVTSKLTAKQRLDAELAGQQFTGSSLRADKRLAGLRLYDELDAVDHAEGDKGLRWI